MAQRVGLRHREKHLAFELRCAAWAEVATVALPARVAMTAALPGGQGVVALLDDGRVVGVAAGAR